MIAGLEIPSPGEILIRGEPMGRRPAYRRPTNTIFQRPALFPHLTVEANVALRAQSSASARAEIRQRVRDGARARRARRVRERAARTSSRAASSSVSRSRARS